MLSLVRAAVCCERTSSDRSQVRRDAYMKRVYPKCQYIHVNIDLDDKASAGHLFSPEDVVIKPSKLYVDYSAKD